MKTLKPTSEKRLSRTQLVFVSFVTVILIGTILLLLPFSQKAGAPPAAPIDALFTATSAVCVTGLVTATTAAQWSLFGQIVVLCLIQIGGLSFIAFFTFLAIALGRKITLDERLLIQTTFNQNTPQGMARLILLIIKGTLLVEGTGAVILFLFFKFKEQLPWGKSLFYGIFHAISGFCNAGFDIIGETNLAPYVHSPVVNFVIMTLIIVGGIGFYVWGETLSFFKKKETKSKKHYFSLHTRLALTTTAVLLIGGTIFFFINEGGNPETIGNMTTPQKLLASAFQSTTLRTAGFSTIPQGGLKESSKFISSIFMLTGGSPGGTAGGIKTVTIAVLLATVWSTLRGRNGTVVSERTIPFKTLQKALTITVIMIGLLFFATAILSYTESGNPFPHTFLDLFYEASSALGTVGLTTGITPFLSSGGKILLILCMLTGRLGPLTVYYSLTKNMHLTQDLISFPEEDVLIG